MKRGTVYQRHTASCPRNDEGTLVTHKCHGLWGYHFEAGRLPNGRRRQVTRSGFPTRSAALAALAEDLELHEAGLDGARRMTVAEYLETWLAGKRSLRPRSAQGYRAHLNLYLVPYLGQIKLADLRPAHLDLMFSDLLASPSRGAATVRRIHATLRSALNSAVKRRLIHYNPALHIELPSATRTPTQVWTPAELSRFLATAASERVGVLFRVVALAGLRRGEVLGLRWEDMDLEVGLLRVTQQLQIIGGVVGFVPPKSRSGVRTVPLDPETVRQLRCWRERQAAERAEWGDGYQDLGLVFTWENGLPLTPDHAYRLFLRLTQRAGLPRIRLHDLRHTSASLALAAGVPLKVVSDRLGHSSIGITADLYTHVVPAVSRDAADRMAVLLEEASSAQIGAPPGRAAGPTPRRTSGGWKRQTPPHS